MAADLITLAEGALLTQFLTPTAKHYGEITLKRIQHLGEQARLLLANVGREPRPVEEKTLFALVEAAALETEPTLADKWAALLANAADPASKIEISISFADILRQIGVAEIRIIQRLEEKSENHRRHGVDGRLGSFASSIGMSEEVFGITVDNLLRLRICELPPNRYEMGKNGQIMQHTSSKDQIEFTMLGIAFLAAVTPPAP